MTSDEQVGKGEIRRSWRRVEGSFKAGGAGGPEVRLFP